MLKMRSLFFALFLSVGMLGAIGSVSGCTTTKSAHMKKKRSKCKCSKKEKKSGKCTCKKSMSCGEGSCGEGSCGGGMKSNKDKKSSGGDSCGEGTCGS